MGIKRILVTGSEGYIGSVLVGELIKKGYAVTGLDSLFFNSALSGKKGYSHLRKDIRKVTLSDLKGIDAVIHLAGLSNDALGQIRVGLTHSINYKATLKLAKLSKKAGVKRFVFSSSCSVYGVADKGIVHEGTTPHPLTEYARSKVLAEEGLKKLASDSFCVALLRNATVYGYSPAFRNDLVVNNFTSRAYALGEIHIESDGTPWRPLVDVRDLSAIFAEFLSVDCQKINGEIINVGFKENNFQVKTLARLVKKRLPETHVLYLNKQPDSRSYKVNFQKFQSIFPGVRQRWDMERSIADIVKELKRTRFSTEDFSSQRYSRLVTLKKLMKHKKLTNHLYWKSDM